MFWSSQCLLFERVISSTTPGTHFSGSLPGPAVSDHAGLLNFPTLLLRTLQRSSLPATCIPQPLCSLRTVRSPFVSCSTSRNFPSHFLFYPSSMWPGQTVVICTACLMFLQKCLMGNDPTSLLQGGLGSASQGLCSAETLLVSDMGSCVSVSLRRPVSPGLLWLSLTLTL